MEYPRLLIDTSILIDHFRNPCKDKTLLYQVSLHYECVISSITEFEFLVGSNQKNYMFINALLSKLPVMPFDSACVQTASQIYRGLKLKHQMISLPDIFIAATAITHNLQFMTLNIKHFEKIENLNLYDIRGL
jgi:tRNA(fMet)-specific endonuclease VapC